MNAVNVTMTRLAVTFSMLLLIRRSRSLSFNTSLFLEVQSRTQKLL